MVRDNMCEFGQPRDTIFYYFAKDLNELYAYYLYEFAAAPGSDITLETLKCKYYRVTNYQEEYVWEATFYSGTSHKIEEYAMQIQEKILFMV